MGERVGGERLHVLGQGVVAPVEEARARAEAASASVPRGETACSTSPASGRALGLAGADHQPHDVVLEGRREMHRRAPPARARGSSLARGACTGGAGVSPALALDQVEDRPLGSAAGHLEVHVQQKPVELRLGQREGALVLDRVLGRDDHERVGQRPRHARQPSPAPPPSPRAAPTAPWAGRG